LTKIINPFEKLEQNISRMFDFFCADLFKIEKKNQPRLVLKMNTD